MSVFVLSFFTSALNTEILSLNGLKISLTNSLSLFSTSNAVWLDTKRIQKAKKEPLQLTHGLDILIAHFYLQNLFDENYNFMDEWIK